MVTAEAPKHEPVSDGPDKIEKSEEEKKKDEEKQEEERKKIIAEPRKAVVVDRVAFQAFAHFDTNLCGFAVFLFDWLSFPVVDLEMLYCNDIFSPLGILRKRMPKMCCFRWA